MIRFKLGDVLRRASCVALALFISINFAFPAFASSGDALSNQLQEVGWAETVSSFLMGCGIYPFNTDENGNFTEWSASSLKSLWNEFTDDVVGVSYDIVDLTGSLVKGVIAIATGRWSVLREFATWLVSKYSLSDNQSSENLGGSNNSNGIPNIGLNPSIDTMLRRGLIAGNLSGEDMYFAASGSGVFLARSTASSVFFLSFNSTYLGYYYRESYSSVSSIRLSFKTSDSSGHVFYRSAAFSVNDTDFPVCVTGEDMYALLTGSSSDDNNSVVVDTTTISIPDELPEGTQFGGVAVQGAGEAVPVETLQQIIRDAVQDALKPGVTFIPVNISPDVEISPDGEISIPVDVGINEKPLVPSDYSAPDITGVFPFSIPWDLMSVLSVLNATPVRPDFEANIYVPVLDVNVPFHIGVTDEAAEAVDNAMSAWRNMLLVLMCVGTLFLIWKIKS